MIFFRPVVSDENSDKIIFEAIENDLICGSCHMTLAENKAVVDSLCFDADKPYLVEGLLKSAFNYAAGKNIYMGYCTCQNITAFLDRMNFMKDNGTYYNDIPSVLQGNCCKKHDNI